MKCPKCGKEVGKTTPGIPIPECPYCGYKFELKET